MYSEMLDKQFRTLTVGDVLLELVQHAALLRVRSSVSVGRAEEGVTVFIIFGVKFLKVKDDLLGDENLRGSCMRSPLWAP